MIVSIKEMRDYIGDLDDSEYEYFATIHNSVEAFVKNYCNRDFESTSYEKEEYSGQGRSVLALKNFPVTAVDRVVTNYINVIRVRNTNTTSYASISVTSTGIRLVKDGTANTSITFASNTTLNAVVSAINGISGWEAELLNSTYSGFKSTELLQLYGLNTINNNWVYLRIPDQAEDMFRVDLTNGWIIKSAGWPVGMNNIYVDYTAGYTTANMPADLKEAIKHFTKHIYNKKEEETFGVTEYRIGINSVLSVFEAVDMPREIKQILNFYRNKKV